MEEELVGKLSGDNGIFFFIRHGERADYASREGLPTLDFEIPYDACMTIRGEEMMVATAQRLLTLIPDLQTRNVFIYSSPFLRALQSAGILIKELGLEEKTRIESTNYLAEELKTEFFDHDPQITLLSRTKPHSYITSQMKDLEYYDDPEQIRFNFPEDYPTAQARNRRMVDLFCEGHQNNRDVVITIGHGTTIREIAYYFDRMPRDESYCSLTILRNPRLAADNLDKKYEKWEMLLHDEDSHVKHFNIEYKP